MSILIKGMEMPKSCPCELIGTGYDVCCSFASGIPARVKEYYECCQNDTRPSWCPLVPVPPHGRLIDADALAKRIKDEGRNQAEYYADRYAPVVMAYGDCCGKVQSAPTIIPAEPSEEQREYEAAVDAVQYCEIYEPTYDPETGAM